MDNAPHQDEPRGDETPPQERNRRRTCRVVLVTCGVIAIVLFASFVAIVTVAAILGARPEPWQSRAKGTLRSIGSSQLAYQGTNWDRNYATFEDLKQDLYIAEGYTLGNMIENYTMTWEVSNTPLVEESPATAGGVGTNRFTIIAFPRDTRPGFLNTFAITEDQIVRVWNPTNRWNEWESVTTWDPIL